MPPEDRGNVSGYGTDLEEGTCPQDNFGDPKIRSLQSIKRPYWFADFDGLPTMMKVSGSKSWRFSYRTAKKEQLLVVCDYPSMMPAQAHKASDAACALATSGQDRGVVRRQKALQEPDGKAQTFERITAQFLDRIGKEGRAPATQEKHLWLQSMGNPDIGYKPVNPITSPMAMNER
jgi:hypothetical protein